MSVDAKEAATIAMTAGLKRRAFSLGAANAIDYAAQFLLPVVLVRCLDTADFGHYRLLWLAAGTVMAVATLAMPSSLYYFLPRSDDATRRLYVNQTLVVLAAAGLIAAWAVSGWNPWLPEQMHGLAAHGASVPAFMLLWVIASLLDQLPTVDERVMWQAKATVGLAALRAVALALAAALTRELGPVLVILVAIVAFKVVLLLAYVARHHGLRGPILRWDAFTDQLKYAVPFAVSGALWGLRAQADQWVAAILFSLGTFASFSIAAVLGPLLNLFRQSVNNAFLPSMSRLQAAGDVSGMVALNSRANVMVGTLIYPLFAFLFVFAEDLVTLIYTATYLDAAPVIRVYTVGLAALVLETATLTLLLRQGAFLMGLNLVTLAFSVAVSWYAAQRLGFVGAAAGSLVAIGIDRIVTLRRVVRLTGLPLRRLQDWRALGLLILFAALAGALAWGIVARHLAASGSLVRLGVGGSLLAATYGAMYVLCGIDRGWLTPTRGPGHGR